MEGKRRLPSWMVGVSTADKVSKSIDADTNDIITKKEVSVVTECKKPKAKRLTGKHKKEVCLPSDETSFVVKCETKRKKRGFVEKDVIECDDSVQEVVVQKRRKRGRVGRKVEESDPSRKKEEKSNEFESREENQASSHDEDDEDLTMDDMLSIAKEFVENDSDMGQQKPSEGNHELNSKSSYASPIVPQDTRSPIHEKTSSHHNSIENLTSKVTLPDSRMTGDPAQDMLDLFLGPLLKKPIGKEEASSIAKDIILPHEVKNQENDIIISNKPVTFAKKKSSLRDAVAMLLD